MFSKLLLQNLDRSRSGIFNIYLKLEDQCPQLTNSDIYTQKDECICFKAMCTAFMVQMTKAISPRINYQYVPYALSFINKQNLIRATYMYLCLECCVCSEYTGIQTCCLCSPISYFLSVPVWGLLHATFVEREGHEENLTRSLSGKFE